MKWNDLFQNPDHVGQSEYRAIHDTIADALSETESVDPDTELDDQKLDTIRVIAGEFEDWSHVIIDRLNNAGRRPTA